MSVKNRLIAGLENSVKQVDPTLLHKRISEEDVVIIDCRENDEYALGSLPDAVHLSRSFLELRIEDIIPNKRTRVVIYCQSGTRSLLACKTLTDMGYEQVESLKGGFQRWQLEGFPLITSPGLTFAERKRYARHISLPEIGEFGQQKLSKARVLLIGAGGLGSSAAYYLAAAGVGTLGLVDHDIVEESNLQRQILHSERTIGVKKVDSAKATLSNLNGRLILKTYAEKLSKDNVSKLFSEYDLVIDGTDNFLARYLINDECCSSKKPLIHGSIFRFEGQVSLFTPGQNNSPCYRCLYPEPPSKGLAPSCGEDGVLGVLPGIIGVFMATEAIKLILNIGRSLVGRLLIYNALEASTTEFKIKRSRNCSCHNG